MTEHTLTGLDAEARILYEEVCAEFTENLSEETNYDYFRYEMYIAEAMLALAFWEARKAKIVAIANAINDGYLNDEKRINNAFRNLVRRKFLYSKKRKRDIGPAERVYGWNFDTHTS